MLRHPPTFAWINLSPSPDTLFPPSGHCSLEAKMWTYFSCLKGAVLPIFSVTVNIQFSFHRNLKFRSEPGDKKPLRVLSVKIAKIYSREV